MPKDDGTAVNDEVVADTTATDSAPVENNESVEADDALGDDAFDEVNDDDDQDDETEGSEQSEPDETQEQPKDDKTQSSPEDEWSALKGTSQERFRQKVNEARELRNQIEELKAQQARFATEQDLLNEVDPDTGLPMYTPQEVEQMSWRESRQAQAERVNQELYGLQVQQNQTVIDDEARQVMEIPVFNPNNKAEFRPEVAKQYVQALDDVLIYALPDGQQANRSTLIANNINPDTQATLVSYTMSPLKLANLIADSYSGAKTQGETLGQANAQRANDRMLANADPAASSSQASSKDTDLDDFDKAWDEYA